MAIVDFIVSQRHVREIGDGPPDAIAIVCVQLDKIWFSTLEKDFGSNLCLSLKIRCYQFT
jgi:hypothetical protein